MKADAAAGAVWMFGAVAAFSIMDATAKFLTVAVPLPQLIFVKSVVQLLFVAPAAVRHGGLKISPAGPHLARGILGVMAASLYFTALGRISLAEANAIHYTSPLLMTAIAWLFGERPALRMLIPLALGFVGTTVVFGLRWSSGISGLLLAFAGTACYSIGVAMLRPLSRSSSASDLLASFSVVATVLSGILLPWFWRTLDISQWILMLVLGALGAVGHLLMARAVALAPVAVVASLEYSSMIWALMFGALVFGDNPKAGVLAGAALIATGSLLAIRTPLTDKSLTGHEG
jgi:drug/metabolite transporter (DMT)-like permease